MLFRMAYLVSKVKIFRQRRYVKLGGDLTDALLNLPAENRKNTTISYAKFV